jgi:hypothetical protein
LVAAQRGKGKPQGGGCARGGGGCGIYGSHRGLGLGRPGLGAGGGRPRCRGGSTQLAWHPSAGDIAKVGERRWGPGRARGRGSADAASEPVPSWVTCHTRACMCTNGARRRPTRLLTSGARQSVGGRRNKGLVG